MLARGKNRHIRHPKQMIPVGLGPNIGHDFEFVAVSDC